VKGLDASDPKKPANACRHTALRIFSALTGRLRIAEAKLIAARAHQKSVGRRLDADKATYLHGSGAIQGSRKRRSLRPGRYLAAADSRVAEQELALLAARKKLDTADEKGRFAAMRQLTRVEKALTEARHDFEAARIQIGQDVKGAKYTPLGPVYSDEEHRTPQGAAEWLTNRQNPLVSRVAVNHIWLRHFGKGLVESVYDFVATASRRRTSICTTGSRPN